jgi:hypothetical protein
MRTNIKGEIMPYTTKIQEQEYQKRRRNRLNQKGQRQPKGTPPVMHNVVNSPWWKGPGRLVGNDMFSFRRPLRGSRHVPFWLAMFNFFRHFGGR